MSHLSGQNDKWKHYRFAQILQLPTFVILQRRYRRHLLDEIVIKAAEATKQIYVQVQSW